MVGDSKRARTMSTDAAPAADAGAADAAHPAIDEDLHSRQLAVYGRGAMRRMAAARVLISGLGGLGAEIGEAESRCARGRRGWGACPPFPRPPTPHTPVCL